MAAHFESRRAYLQSSLKNLFMLAVSSLTFAAKSTAFFCILISLESEELRIFRAAPVAIRLGTPNMSFSSATDSTHQLFGDSFIYLFIYNFNSFRGELPGSLGSMDFHHVLTVKEGVG